MNRRSLITMLGLAPLVAACRGPQTACSPVDGLLQGKDAPVCSLALRDKLARR